jgi:predicted DNA-binding transcriptional regulator AlpA
MQSEPRIRIDTPEFCRQSGLSSTTLWRLSKRDPDFPTPIYILNKKLYFQDEVIVWIQAQERTEPTHNNLMIKSTIQKQLAPNVS